jgi:pimeloyl-ACP methyl ester carboxylesterase
MRTEMVTSSGYDGSMPYLDIFSVPHSYCLTPKKNPSQITLVFVHGWLLSQCYWQPIIDELGQDFQCLTYDLRGFGESNTGLEARSPKPSPTGDTPHPYSLAAYAEDLGYLLEALNLESVWLVGHSLGGSVALWAAKLFPERIQGVICVNAGGGVYLPDEFERFRRAGQQIVRWRPQWLKAVPFVDCAFSQMMVYRTLDLQWGAKRVADLLAAHAAAAAGVLLESTTEAEVHLLPQVLSGLQQPVYFIAGAEDTVMDVKYVKHLASFHPLFESAEGNVEVIAECGHIAMLEQPQAIAAAIRKRIPTKCADVSESQPSDSVLK